MPIKVTCSNCGGVLHAPDDSAGKRGRCPTCGTVLTITPDPVGVPATPFGAPPAPGRFPPEPSPAQINNPWGSLPGGSDESQHGVQVSNRPGLSSQPALPRQSQLPIPPQPEPVPPSHGSRVPPDPRKFPPAANDPFSKPSRPKSDDQEAANQWQKVRRGLGWIRTGVFFCLLGTLAYCAIPLLQQLGVKLPDQSPGWLKQGNFSQTEEIRFFATLGPILLGLLCTWFGRLGLAASPASAYARSPSVWCGFATFLALGGLIAYLVMTSLSVWNGTPVPQFTPDPSKPSPTASLATKVEHWFSNSHMFLVPEEFSGKVQGIGAMLFVVFGLLAEVWFVATLGRMAASLRNQTAAGRVNRFVVLVGLLFAITVIGLMLARVFFPAWCDANVWAKWEGLDAKSRAFAIYGTLAAVALLFAILYWRMIGGVRHAISESYD